MTGSHFLTINSDEDMPKAEFKAQMAVASLDKNFTKWLNADANAEYLLPTTPTIEPTSTRSATTSRFRTNYLATTCLPVLAIRCENTYTTKNPPLSINSMFLDMLLTALEFIIDRQIQGAVGQFSHQ